MSIYVKSRCRGNPRGAGEAAALVEYIDGTGKSHIRERRIQIEHGTKNALDLEISIAALRILIKPCHVTFYTECDYMKNVCEQGWLKKWRQEHWKKADGKPPANVGEWKQFFMLAQIHTIVFTKYDNRHDEELKKVLDNGCIFHKERR